MDFKLALLLSGLVVAAAGVSCVGDVQAFQVTAGGVPEAQRVQATGDPHMQNIYGQRFDLMRPGRYTLIHIPKAAAPEETLLRVDADAVRLGAHCSDMYFQELNLTGSWAEDKQSGGFQFHAGEAGRKQESKWLSLKSIDLKVVHGRTADGTDYLNFHVKHLGRARYVVGGLLGEDDHAQAATPDPLCSSRLSLWSEEQPQAPAGGMTDASIAVASLL